VANLLEQYEKATRDEGKGPSGWFYKWHFPTAMEYAAIMGGLPGLFKATDAKAPADSDAVAKANELNRDLAVRCVDYPVLVEDGQEPPADRDWLPISKLSQADLGWLATRIMSGTHLDSDLAETMRRAL
jgi:hypothetical protein